MKNYLRLMNVLWLAIFCFWPYAWISKLFTDDMAATSQGIEWLFFQYFGWSGAAYPLFFAATIYLQYRYKKSEVSNARLALVSLIPMLSSMPYLIIGGLIGYIIAMT
ncbi:hypothetical protein ACFSJY_15705 [Thalassotalea euphylliae]|uniref:hypothetical protein n=1 Tax=Thalassotalea euphylliae TaxID=1655234 RepID=UPI00364239F7